MQHAVHPRAQVRAGLEAIVEPVRLEERVLDEILGVALRARQAERRAGEREAQRREEGALRRLVDGGEASEAGDYGGRDPDASEDDRPGGGRGHGTNVAGVLAAARGNGEGITGVAPGVRLVPLRAFGADGLGEDDDVAAAIVLTDLETALRMGKAVHVRAAAQVSDYLPMARRDVLAFDGWDVRFLGSNLPGRDIVQEVARIRPSILGISMSETTMSGRHSLT